MGIFKVLKEIKEAYKVFITELFEGSDDGTKLKIDKRMRREKERAQEMIKDMVREIMNYSKLMTVIIAFIISCYAVMSA